MTGRPTEAFAARDLGAALARRHGRVQVGGPAGPLRSLRTRLTRFFRRVDERLTRVESARVAPGAEWLIDNAHVVLEALRQVEQHLPSSYYRELPKLVDPVAGREARIHAIAADVITEAGGLLDASRVEEFLTGYQEVTPLTMGELWAFPAMLRLSLLEVLSVAAAEVTGLSPPAASPGLPPAGSSGGLEHVIATCIKSLRWIGTHDWKLFFEAVSLVHRTLAGEPAGVYPRMDFETRNSYRRVVESLARWSGASESAVAKAAIERCRLVPDPASRAAHVGFHLIDEGRRDLEESLECWLPLGERIDRFIHRFALPLYLGAVGALSLLLAGLVAAFAGSLTPAGVLVALLPASGASVALVNRAVIRLIHPRRLPRLDPDREIPPEARTVVVVPTLLHAVEDLEEVLAGLERNFHGNDLPVLDFVLLTDFSDAETEHQPGDATLLELAQSGIVDLNVRLARDHPVFHLVHRDRRWNPAENRWMGWERKRGKLVEFNRLVLGTGEITLRVVAGDLNRLREARYAITLDADTVLPHAAAGRLIATLAHPLNKPQFTANESGERVAAGYTVLQPRLATTPARALQSQFAEALQAETGLDLYDRIVSDVYQDLFGQSVYAGKGIYEIAGFERSHQGRVPANSLLSHDLFEGVLGRTGFASDVVLLEDLPIHPVSYFRRLHRWVRGDWQLLPWLGGRVPSEAGSRSANLIGALGRWMIFDNLRRSLLAPGLLLLFLLGWVWLPGTAWKWTVAGAALLAIPVLLDWGAAALTLLTRSWGYAADRMRVAGRAAVRWMLDLGFLAHQSLVIIDAIVRTLWRLGVSRRHLLEWTTFAHAERAVDGGASTWRAMAGSPLFAIGATGLLLLLNPTALPGAAILLLFWMIAPGVGRALARPRPERQEHLSEEERRRLRAVARRTWHFFERFLGPAERWLPPDNFQEAPGAIVARRTSPTNVGMSLTSVIAAYDLGYTSLLELTASLHSVREGMARLERYRGHLFNWYDTRNDQPLEPRYVSTVDSGNLAAALLAVQHGCRQAENDPVIHPALREGVLDTVVVLDELLSSARGSTVGAVGLVRDSLEILRNRLDQTEHEVASHHRLFRWIREEWTPALTHRASSLALEPATLWAEVSRTDVFLWIELLQEDLMLAERLVQQLTPWGELLVERRITAAGVEDEDALWAALVGELTRVPRLSEMTALAARAGELITQLEARLAAGRMSPQPTGGGGLGSWLGRLRLALDRASEAAGRVLQDLEVLAEAMEEWVRGMDFRFLYDDNRRLFWLGYNVTDARYDGSHYDLLASEARLASLVAIAKGDIPATHWIRLQRPLARAGGDLVLLSWGGTMFEFLMPALYTRSPPRTLLHQALSSAIRQQIRFGARRGVPWGVSESGFASLDPLGNYNYRAFGVPGLAIRRDLGDRVVVAPYAAALALPFAPQTTLKNLERIAAAGGLGRYGFYEALDYGRAPTQVDGRPNLVRSYMAHHQGMALVAMNNAINDHAMTRRVHADLRIASVEPLLQERTAQQPTVETRRLPGDRPPQPSEPPPITQWTVDPADPIPALHVLSNGRYNLMLSAAGGGSSRWQGLALTRWRADPSPDSWGPWLYLQDRDTGQLWSATAQPPTAPIDAYSTRFESGAVEYACRHNGLAVQIRVVVPVEEDVELRIVTIRSLDERRRRLAFTSYGEVALSAPEADRRHPAFSKLFVESSALPELDTLMFRRRPRGETEDTVFFAHRLVRGPGCDGPVSWETDRARFLGRTGGPVSPTALRPRAGPLSRTTGDVLDPVFALRCQIDLDPDAKVEFALLSTAGRTRESVLDRLATYRAFSFIEWTAGRTSRAVEQAMRERGLLPSELPQAAQLFSALVTPYHGLRGPLETLAATKWSQASLWPLGISGDLPIVLVFASGVSDALLGEVLRAHAHWRRQGSRVDLVLVDEEPGGYAQPVRDAIHQALEETNSASWLGRPGGVHVVEGHRLTEQRDALLCAARVVLHTDRGALGAQLERLRARPLALPGFTPFPGPGPLDEGTEPIPRPTDLLFTNGLGGFTPDGREYVLHLEPGSRPPAPWSNVCANPELGCLVTDTGLDTTWSVNSAEQRLTPWRNDPVNPPPAEVVYVRDEETGEVWSATPEPSGQGSTFEIHHGQGYSEFRSCRRGLLQQLRVMVHPTEPVKFLALTVTNQWRRARRITVTHYAEWVFGTVRDVTAPHIVTEYDDGAGALLARGSFSVAAADRVVVVGASQRPHGFTCDRQEFLGSRERWALPAGLIRIGLSGTVGPGRDPCSALQVHLDLGPGDTRTIHFVLARGTTREDALSLLRRWRTPEALEEATRALDTAWNTVCGQVTIETPDRAANVLVNRWLPYQVLSARVWGRTGLYQASGAFGFRDQLQDVLALLHVRPDVTRNQLIETAAHQFREGDVLHWWHPDTGAGVRTRCSDDLAWLPFVTAHYVETTQDTAIFDAEAPFLDAPPLEPGELQRYTTWKQATEPGTLYEHCRRALDRAFTAGPHGLPLIGSGDWNDGLDRVGIAGRGESVWLGWFLCAVAKRFARVAREVAGQAADAERWEAEAERVRRAVEDHGWDGAWYRRAYHDDGSVLGSRESEACQIDSIAQSWGVLSGAAEPSRAEQAMEAVVERLAKWEDGVVLLLTPPFVSPRSDPGYIAAYPPGIRENGAQYTHAAAWAAWAFADLGRADVAGRLLTLLNPINLTSTPKGIARYRGEPYVLAGDVGGTPPHLGRAGWTWYTGAAGWFYRFVLEGLLGIRRRGTSLEINPRLPPDWHGFSVRYRHGTSWYDIRVDNGDGAGQGVRSVVVDGSAIEEPRVPLVDDGGQHQVEVVLGSRVLAG